MTRDRLELEGAKEHGQDRGWWIAEVITQPVTSGVQSADINVRAVFPVQRHFRRGPRPDGPGHIQDRSRAHPNHPKGIFLPDQKFPTMTLDRKIVPVAIETGFDPAGSILRDPSFGRCWKQSPACSERTVQDFGCRSRISGSILQDPSFF